MVKIGQQKDYFKADANSLLENVDTSIPKDVLDECASQQTLHDELPVKKTTEEFSEQCLQKTENSHRSGNKKHDSDEDSDVELHVRGKPKSGRIWKTEKKRASSIIKTRGLKLSLDKKKMLREQLKRVKEHSREIKEQRKKEREDKRLRAQENAKRKEENRKKSEVVQIIKNSAKIKKMRKKQLRQIVKRDTTIVKTK